ncbi:MAG: HAD-IIIA family hydrolase [Gammaproteobacteria bacterium]|jgi:D-glycero-D-manno-heptose 1,7-bisphosphate phosphatase
MVKLAILGALGVLVEEADGPGPDWLPLPGSLEAVGRLNRAGIRVVLAFNEPALGRGSLTPQALNARHHRLCARLARIGAHLEGIFFCPHAPEAGCGCRIPATGLHEEILRRFGVEAGNSVLIGVTPDELAAAGPLGARAIMLTPVTDGSVRVAGPRSLAEAVEGLLRDDAP